MISKNNTADLHWMSVNFALKLLYKTKFFYKNLLKVEMFKASIIYQCILYSIFLKIMSVVYFLASK